MILQQLAMGTFSSYATAEVALRELKDKGFWMDRVAIVGRDLNNHTEFTGANTSNSLVDLDGLHTDENQAGATATDRAIMGGSIGGFAGLLVGLGALTIPGFGPVMLASAAATAIATAISGGVIGAATGSLVGGLVGLGIPNDRAQIYSDRVSQGDYLVIVEGSESDIALAESILSEHHIENWYIYDLPNVSGQSIQTVETATPAPINLNRPRLRV